MLQNKYQLVIYTTEISLEEIAPKTKKPTLESDKRALFHYRPHKGFPF